MPVVMTDEQLRQAKLTEHEARIELACRLFDIGKLSLAPAAQVAGLTRAEFEEQLIKRNLPIHRYTEEAYEQDKENLKKWGL